MPDGPIRFVRRKRILEELDIDSATLWKWEKSGRFVAGVVLNPGAEREIRAYREDAYEEWKAARPTRMARPARHSPYPKGVPTGRGKKKKEPVVVRRPE